MVQSEFRHLRLNDIEEALSGHPAAFAGDSRFLWTILSYVVLTIYDRLGTIYAGHKVSYGRVAFASFCAYALSHNLGFAAVSGAAVRYRLYAHWGLTPLQIGKTVAFCSLTFGLGGMVLGGAILFVEPRAIPFFGQHLPLVVLYGVGALLWVIVIGYVTLSRILGSVRLFGHEIELPGWRMAILQVLLATVDVAITASIFYALLPPAPNLTWLIFLGVYVASYTAGLAANLPGGIGVFDTAMLFGLEPYISAPHIVGAIVVFRLYYYIIPLFLAGSLFTGNEILLRGDVLLRRVERLGAVQATWRAGASLTSRSPAPPALVGAVRCDDAVRRHPGATAGLLLDRPRLRRDGQSGRPVRSVADWRRADRDGDRPVASGEPGLGSDDIPAGAGRRVHRHAGRAAVDRRRAGDDGNAGRTAARLLLPPRQPAEWAAGTRPVRCRCSLW